MPEHETPESSLKVSDRRKFTSSGERRPGVEDEEPAAAPPRVAPPPPPPAAKPDPGPPPRQQRLAQREVTFNALLEMLYGNALMFLGLAAPPGEPPRIELEGARETIDMLGVLQTKTHGNLTAEENEALKNILYDLRMAYAEVAKAVAGPRGAQLPRR